MSPAVALRPGTGLDTAISVHQQVLKSTGTKFSFTCGQPTGEARQVFPWLGLDRLQFVGGQFSLVPPGRNPPVLKESVDALNIASKADAMVLRVGLCALPNLGHPAYCGWTNFCSTQGSVKCFDSPVGSHGFKVVRTDFATIYRITRRSNILPKGTEALSSEPARDST